MRQVVVVRAHTVLGAVASATARAHHGIAAERVGKGEFGARLEVRAVVHAGRKRGRCVANALAADHVAHRRVRIRDKALDVMEERIEPLERRKTRRHREHELGIDHREARKQARIAQAELLVGLLARDHAAGIGLRSGPRRGGHAHERQRVVGDRQAAGGAAHHVIPDVTGGLGAVLCHARVGRHGADALAAVHDRAAAEREHEVAALGAREPAAVVHRLAERVGLDAVEEHVAHARAGKLRLHARQVAVGLDRRAARGHHERTRAGELLVPQLGEFARPEQHARGRKERITPHLERSPLDLPAVESTRSILVHGIAQGPRRPMRARFLHHRAKVQLE